ncbi:hypothetical protein PN498_07090 [Oscillatoria sp. CS-180]|uniref:hypothetical protein n=1 Tax=Oscillatoria sp. CS-180 TaxID=3021720 RepID=UPI00232F185A|nr:hypothetical protein [Oscillatoria sp. CS-180]MDB9525747.1 hypothetical protein [Oscillatoria sp. CS-180]
MREQLRATAFYIGDNVEVDPDVVIASGAVLEAAPGSRLIVQSGVCIGCAVVVQAYGGDLTLATGVSLGKEVLLVGTGTVGERACIGAESTLINPEVAADAVIPARSLLGNPTANNSNGQGNELPPEASEFLAESSHEDNGSAPNDNNGNGQGPLASTNPVYGRDQVMQLVKTLFPHRDSLNSGSDSS